MQTERAEDGRLTRTARWCALAYVVVSTLTILGTTGMAPWFSWTANALSDLGAAGEVTRPFFNGGLVVGGVLGVVVGGWLALDRDGIGRVAGVALVVTMVLRVGIGLFPTDTALHNPIAIGYFLGVAVSLWLVAAGRVVGNEDDPGNDSASDGGALLDVSGDARTEALVAVVGGTLVPVVWVSWGVGWQSVAPGFAIPEVLSSLGLLAWLSLVGFRLQDEETAFK